MSSIRSPSWSDLKHRLDQYFSKQRPLGVLAHVWISGPGQYSRPPGAIPGGGAGMGRDTHGGPNFSDFCVLVPCQPSHHIPGCPWENDVLPACSMCTADAALYEVISPLVQELSMYFYNIGKNITATLSIQVHEFLLKVKFWNLKLMLRKYGTYSTAIWPKLWKWYSSDYSVVRNREGLASEHTVNWR